METRVEQYRSDERFKRYGYDKVYEAERVIMRNMQESDRDEDTIWNFLFNLEKAEEAQRIHGIPMKEKTEYFPAQLRRPARRRHEEKEER